MSQEVQREIYAETGHDFSGDFCPNAALNDLDDTAIETFRLKWFEKCGNARIKTMPAEQLMADIEAVLGGQVTYAALSLFGKREALGRCLPQCRGRKGRTQDTAGGIGSGDK